jgi:YVTN family beta-propeller protein
MKTSNQRLFLSPRKRYLLLAITALVAFWGIITADAAQTPVNQVVATVPVNGYPSFVTVSPDSSTVYVLSNSSDNLTVFNASTYQVTASLTINGPNAAVVSPDGSTLYVTANNSVEVISTASGTVTTTITVGDTPMGLAISPDGSQLYVANQYSGTVSVIDTASETVSATLTTNGNPVAVVWTSSGTQADVLNSVGEGFLQFINTSTQTVSSKTYDGGNILSPSGITSDPTGATLYINANGYFIVVIDAVTGKVKSSFIGTATVPFAATVSFGQPAVTPGQKYLYLPYAYAFVYGIGGGGGYDDEVMMINLSKHTIEGQPIVVGTEPVWAAIAPNGNTLYVANQSDETVSVVNITPAQSSRPAIK